MTARLIVGLSNVLNAAFLFGGIIWAKRPSQTCRGRTDCCLSRAVQLEPLPKPGVKVQALVEDDCGVVDELEAMHYALALPGMDRCRDLVADRWRRAGLALAPFQNQARSRPLDVVPRGDLARQRLVEETGLSRNRRLGDDRGAADMLGTDMRSRHKFCNPQP